MKRVQDVAALQRLALATGAEVVLEGKHFNASRETVASAPATAPVPPPAAPAPDPAPPPAAHGVTHEEVERMLAANDRMWSERMRRHEAELRQAMASMPVPEPEPQRPVEWVATSEYDTYGRHLRTRLVPTYEGQG